MKRYQIKWADIPGVKSLLISNNGYVMNKDTQVIRKLKHHPSGYVQLWDKNNKKELKIHRLVALSFIPNPDNKKCVNHIDGNKKNNSIINLEWVTHKENSRHASDTGLMKMKGSKNPNSKLTEMDIIKIRELRKNGVSLLVLSEMFNIDKNYISHITMKNSKCWPHVTK